ncbi:hypothetical protein [Saccharicrinis aurantiacus]|uniref:hypothetical protein n=1 Tax=Saccharicrinis aurantiacus TaxID=1849719 RepID=UPI000837C85A|nr:hypothetical protein [Saccharicrinis aurantiacus]
MKKLIVLCVLSLSLGSLLKAEMYRDDPPPKDEDDAIHAYSIVFIDPRSGEPTDIPQSEFNPFAQDATSESEE